MPRRYNLILVSRQGINTLEEFHRLAQYVHEIDPAITPYVVEDHRLRPWNLRQQLKLRSAPTFVFSPAHCDRFRPPRGTVSQGKTLDKTQEMDALRAAGIPVPDYVQISQTHRPDLSHLGEYVVVKPDRGGRGANVIIMRHGRVKWQPQETRIAGKSNTMLVQRFIYTGQWPVSYRVTTLFGKVLWSDRSESGRNRKPLDESPETRNFGGLSIVSTGNDSTIQLNYDEEIIRFAEAAHAAFPNHPLLGTDVIREVPSGKLYILEVNSSGYVWHFSSPLGLEFQMDFNINLESQFDGIRKAAQILAEKTRERAT